MNRRPLPQIFLGVLIVAIGVLALLVQLELINLTLGELFGTWWPIVIISVGLAALLTVPRAWIGPVAIILVGLMFQLSRLNLVELNIWGYLWPMAVILLGLSMLTRLGTHTSEDETVNAAVIWWGAERSTTTPNYRGGSLSAVMGGIELDLRQAGMATQAQIAVFTLWGGVEIKVPSTWRVTVSGLPLLGGWENTTIVPDDPNAPELVVHITAVMGGVEIKN